MEKDATQIVELPRSKGIINCGSTCFINAVIHALLYCKPFHILLLSDEVQHLVQKNTFINGLCDMVSHTNTKLFNPSPMLSKMQQFLKGKMMLNEQNDALEWLLLLFEIIDDALPELTLKTRKEQSSFMKMMNAEWLKQKITKHTHIYQGQQTDVITCTMCNHSTLRPDRFGSLFIESSVTSIQRWLADFTTGVVDWSCDKCHVRHANRYQRCIVRAPDILILVVKIYDERLRRTTHQLKGIETALDLSSNIVPKQLLLYRLRSFVCHVGNINNGHYYSVCRRKRQWFIHDDERVERVEHPLNHLGRAYLFLYERVR